MSSERSEAEKSPSFKTFNGISTFFPLKSHKNAFRLSFGMENKEKAEKKTLLEREMPKFQIVEKSNKFYIFLLRD